MVNNTQAVILAAGRGLRLQSLAKEIPKCLIEIGKKTLLERSLDNLAESGIKEAVIMTGFKDKSVRKKIGKNYKGIKIIYIKNKEYQKTGSMSLFMAKNLIKGDILLLECDLLYEKRAINILLESGRKNVILAAGFLDSGDDVYIRVDKNDKLIDLGKDISKKEKAIGALVGISKFSKSFLKRYCEFAENDYSKGRKKRHYEEVVLDASGQGEPVFVEMRGDLNWIEIDNEKDFKRAKKEIYPRIKNYEKN